MSTPSVRLRIALVATVCLVAVLIGSSLTRSDDQPSTSSTPGRSSASSPTESSATSAAVPRATIAPARITVLPDWYRKQSSRYAERRPSTVPPDVPTTTEPRPVMSNGLGRPSFTVAEPG